MFEKWLKHVKDRRAKASILNRLNMISELGNFGDHKSVGGKVSELRLSLGKGYRVYYTVKGGKVVLLLAGGVKDTQPSDIRKAQQIVKEMR